MAEPQIPSRPALPTEPSPAINELRAGTAQLPLRQPAADAFAGKVLLMSGGSRGIGFEIALAAARHGADIAIMAKTAEPDPRIPGTIHTAAEAIREAGGRVLPYVGDIRSDDNVKGFVEATIAEFGRIDMVVNNASAINLSPTPVLPLKRYDLMMDINSRGTFSLVQAALPHLAKSDNPHVLTLSPPVNLEPGWLGNFPAYALSKFGMTILTLGWAHEFGGAVSANCLWPETTIATAAVANTQGLGGDEAIRHSRTPQIMADAAVAILASERGTVNGHTLVDADVLRSAGVEDLSGYGGEEPLNLDLFL